MNIIEIKQIFNKYDFKTISFIYAANGLIFIVEKDYSKNFSFHFDGIVRLKVMIYFQMERTLNITTYPEFYELSNKIPKKAVNHIYSNGSICYAPRQRPFQENWNLSRFVSAVDAMINNFFSLEYTGKSLLVELEHGDRGVRQYNNLLRDNKKGTIL